MNAELLYEALNDRHSLEQLDERELGKLVGSYPYFSIGQLLLAKKQRQTSSKESYQQQREHLHAFFRNPWWLYYQLELADLTATPAYVAQVPYRFETPAPFESIATRAGGDAVATPSAPETPAPVAAKPEAPTPSDPHTPPSAPEVPPTPHPSPEPEVPRPSPEPETPQLPREPGTPQPSPEIPAPSEPEVPPAIGPDVPAPADPTVPSPSGPEMTAEGQHRHGFMPWPGMEEEEMDIPTLMGSMTHEAMPHELAPHEVVPHETVPHEAAAHEVMPPHATIPSEPIAEPFLPYMVTSAIAEVEVAGTPAAAPETQVEEPEPQAVEPEMHLADSEPHTAEPEMHSAVPEPHVVEPEAPAPTPEQPLAAAPPPAQPEAPLATHTPLAPAEEDPYDAEDPDDTDGPAPSGEGAAQVHHLDTPAPAPAFPTGEPAPFPFSLTPLSHDFTFEPLHTVDYFASQGIKLDLEENPTDTLTRHLKSFTEWLKTMKRISPMEARHTDLDAATEAEIQQLASSANHQREAVLTESMAHVWVLQGKIHKAVEVYNKLSLQHPEKRAYFAAKIEQLNKL